MNRENSALEILEGEHQKILNVLGAFDAYCDAVASGTEVDRQDLGRFVMFIRNFVDTHHHGKEERVLFPAMAKAGFPAIGQPGPLSVMMEEHDIGRATLAELASFAASETWPEDVLPNIAAAGHRFAELMRAHIHKENNVLYPMARGRLTDEQMAAVDSRCAEVDKEWDSTDPAGALVAIGRELSERYGQAE